MPLVTSQIDQFQHEGYTTAPGFFVAAEVAAMCAELDRLRGDGAFRNVATEADGKTASASKQNLQICPLYDRSMLFKSLPFAAKVRESIGLLIGDPVVLHLD